MERPGPPRIAVDIGGTFTDVALDHDGALHTAKTLTTQNDPVRGVIDMGGTTAKLCLLDDGKPQRSRRAGAITRTGRCACGFPGENFRRVATIAWQGLTA